MKICLFASLAGLAAASSAVAAPFEQPSFDASTRPEVKLEIKVKHGGGEGEVFGPALDVTLPVRPGLETSFTFGAVHAKADGASRSGASDVEWAAKWEIIPEDGAGDGLYVSTEPALVAPTGTHGLSEGWAAEVPLLVGRNFGPWKLRAMLAYEHNFRADEDEIGVSLLAYRKFTDTFGTGLELAADAEPGALSDRELRLNLGLKWEVAQDLEFSARVGRSIARPHGEPADTAVALYLERAF
jgi:hypothetical protein